jgi:hypothetical protein
MPHQAAGGKEISDDRHTKKLVSLHFETGDEDQDGGVGKKRRRHSTSVMDRIEPP